MADIENAIIETQTPKYILKLGVPVTHRWKDKQGVPQSRTYPVGTELGVLFPYIVRRRNQKWADCITAEGIVLTIGHNRNHQLIEIATQEPTNVDIADAVMEEVKLPIDKHS